MMQRSICKCVQRQRTLRSVTAVGGGRPWLAASATINNNNSMQARPSLLEQIRSFRTTPSQMMSEPPDNGYSTPTSPGIVCFNCGEKGHLKKDCTSPRKEMKHRVRCYNCGKVGHMAFECPEPDKPKACYNCGDETHIARDCPNPPKND
jgi:hypothetical protein